MAATDPHALTLEAEGVGPYVGTNHDNRNTTTVVLEEESKGDRVGGEADNEGSAEGKGEGAVAATDPHALALEAEGVGPYVGTNHDNRSTTTVVVEAEREGDRVGGEADNEGTAEGKGEGAVAATDLHALTLEVEGLGPYVGTDHDNRNTTTVVLEE